MNRIIVNLPRNAPNSYLVDIQKNLLSQPEKWLPENIQANKIVIITDKNVADIYGNNLCRVLDRHNPLLIAFNPGEQSKNFITKQYIESEMLLNYCDRETIIFALGGGVVGDLAGYVASTYMRGISYIQIPTTLLAMIDSSIGGKTGINSSMGKNLIGTFWQPSGVVTDLNCLETLPVNHIINGLIEALKIFLTNDRDYFFYSLNNIDSAINKDLEVLSNIIINAVSLKKDVIISDEKESNQRMVLNMGHTIGHAVEKTANYKILHGFSVALGILVETRISLLLGILSNDEFHTIRSLLMKLGIEGRHLKEFDHNDIIKATQHDKKAKSKSARFVLLESIGKACTKNNAYAFPVPEKVIRQALLDVMEV